MRTRVCVIRARARAHARSLSFTLLYFALLYFTLLCSKMAEEMHKQLQKRRNFSQKRRHFLKKCLPFFYIKFLLQSQRTAVHQALKAFYLF